MQAEHPRWVYEPPLMLSQGLVVHAQRHGEGMTVLAAVSQVESRGVTESTRRATNHFGHVRQRWNLYAMRNTQTIATTTTNGR